MSKGKIFLSFPKPQCKATFLRRPQRFLAEMEFSDGVKEIVYCANSGAMTTCLAAGSRALLWDSADLKRKRRYTWRAVESKGVWIGTDTQFSNFLVEKVLKQKLLLGLEAYETVDREQALADGYRVDFLLSGSQGDCYIEVKTITVVENSVARYPDSLTLRGVKQLQSLTRLAIEGNRVILIFLVQRDDAVSFVISSSHDPAYAEAFDQAIAAGVEVIALEVSVSPKGFGIPQMLPYAKGKISARDTRQVI